MTTAEEWIATLGLEPHIEGGYFRRTYTSPTCDVPGPEQPKMSSIYYMLTRQSPFGRLHRNNSDIVHYFHDGGSLEYFLLPPDGVPRIVRLGRDPQKGESLQLVVEGGVWKATRLVEGGEFALISEAVTPAFDYQQMQLADERRIAEWLSTYPQLAEFIG